MLSIVRQKVHPLALRLQYLLTILVAKKAWNNIVLLNASLPDTHEARLIVKFVTSVFQINLTEEASNLQENVGSDEEEASKPDKIAVRQESDDIDVGRTVIDFELCFTTGSTAWASLRKESSVNAVRFFAKEQNKFFLRAIIWIQAEVLASVWILLNHWCLLALRLMRIYMLYQDRAAQFLTLQFIAVLLIVEGWHLLLNRLLLQQ